MVATGRSVSARPSVESSFQSPLLRGNGRDSICLASASMTSRFSPLFFGATVATGPPSARHSKQMCFSPLFFGATVATVERKADVSFHVVSVPSSSGQRSRPEGFLAKLNRKDVSVPSSSGQRSRRSFLVPAGPGRAVSVPSSSGQRSRHGDFLIHVRRFFKFQSPLLRGNGRDASYRSSRGRCC